MAHGQEKLVIWGASGHASVVGDIVRLQGIYDLIGFLDDVNPDRHGCGFCGAKVLGGRDDLQALVRAGVRHAIVGFGECQARLRVADWVRTQGMSLAKAIHPSAVVARTARVREGTVITACAVVNPGSVIGANTIINTSATVDHDCVIEDGVSLAPGVHLGGKVTIRRGARIGVGATVIDRVTVGAGSVIGAGAVVVRDIPDRVLAYGVPARVVEELADS